MTNETTATKSSNGAGEQKEEMATGVERVGETGLVLRMRFPHTTTREDFLIAFHGWLQQYKQTVETSYLVQALVAEKVASERGEDTSGYFFGLIPILVGAAGAWIATDEVYSRTTSTPPSVTPSGLARWMAYDARRH
jgi:hypothetical protein